MGFLLTMNSGVLLSEIDDNINSGTNFNKLIIL